MKAVGSVLRAIWFFVADDTWLGLAGLAVFAAMLLASRLSGGELPAAGGVVFFVLVLVVLYGRMVFDVRQR